MSKRTTLVAIALAVAAVVVWRPWRKADVASLPNVQVPLVESREWNLPPAIPPPQVPPDNPMSEVKVELGRHLFHDKRLSGNRTQSCASCHRSEIAFTDGRRTARGSTGQEHFRNSMTLANVAYSSSLTWADASVRSLEAQAIVPITNRAPVEMGMADKESELIDRIESDPVYRRLFREAFPDDPSPISIPNVMKAIASFERTILSFDSPYDRFVFRGDVDALSPEAWRGMQLFFSDKTKCGECHSGLNLAGPSRTPDSRPEPVFHDTALYAIGTERSYPETDNGLRRATHRREDDGRFKVPTLRNIAVTAPYMHDGSIATLEEVVDHYACGGRAAENPGKSELLGGFTLSPDEKAALIAFLESLTDENFLSDAGYSNPWPDGS